MKSTGLFTAAAVLVATGLLGVVWFETPKSERQSGAAKLAKHDAPARPSRPPATQRSPKAEPNHADATTPPSPQPTAHEMIDLRASSAESDTDESVQLEATDEQAASSEAAAHAPADDCELAQSEALAAPAAQVDEPSAPPAATLLLELRDAEGRPVHAPQVVARWRDGEVLREAVATELDSGRVAFSQPLGDGVVLQARGEGLAPTMFGPLTQATLARQSLAMTLPRGSALRGTTNARGAASLVAWPAGNQGLAARFELELDETGEFALDGVWNGPLEALLLDSDGHASAVQSLPSADAQVHFVTQPGVSVQGVVFDPSGAPLSGVAVEALAAHEGFGVATLSSTVTDSEGRFTLPQAPAGALVQARAPGLAPCWSSAPREGELHVRLAPRRALTIVLDGVGANDGEWTLSAWGIEDLAARSTSNGRFEFDGLAPGPYSFALREPDGAVRHFNYALAPDSDEELVLRLR